MVTKNVICLAIYRTNKMHLTKYTWLPLQIKFKLQQCRQRLSLNKMTISQNENNGHFFLVVPFILTNLHTFNMAYRYIIFFLFNGWIQIQIENFETVFKFSKRKIFSHYMNDVKMLILEVTLMYIRINFKQARAI